MYRFFGETDAYSLFNTLASFLPVIVSVLYYKIKKERREVFEK